MPDEVSGVIRHAVTTAGGALVAAGYLTQDQLSTVAGAAAIIVGVVWSIAAKRVAKQPSKQS